MNESEQLRDLLTRAVPEAPEAAAGPLAAAGQRSRDRRRVAVSAAALVAVIVVAVGLPALLVGDDPGDDRVRPAAPAALPPPAVDPYTTLPCPTSSKAGGTLELTGFTAARLCLAGSPLGVPVDALVEDLGQFTGELADLREVRPNRCAGLDYYALPYVLVLDTGRTEQAVRTELCGDVRIGSRVVDGEEVQQAFVTALERQRERFEYRSDDPTISCDVRRTTGPVDPTRDRLLAARVCHPSPSRGVDVPLSVDGLADLGKAFAKAVNVTNSGPRGGPCSGDSMRAAEVIARTDRGDSVRFYVTSCAGLVVQGIQEEDRYFLLDVALADLGYER